MLKINDLHTYYGNVHALKGVSLEVRQGEIIALIGSNGAGKSTLIDTVIGTVHSKQGTITFKDAIRFEKGEGIEKKQENFAEEIASMVKG